MKKPPKVRNFNLAHYLASKRHHVISYYELRKFNATVWKDKPCDSRVFDLME